MSEVSIPRIKLQRAVMVLADTWGNRCSLVGKRLWFSGRTSTLDVEGPWFNPQQLQVGLEENPAENPWPVGVNNTEVDGSGV